MIFLQRRAAFTSTDQLNTFIEQAEQRIFNSIQFPVIRKNVTGTTTSGNKYLATPVDFLSVFSLAVQLMRLVRMSFCLNKDVNFIREAYPSPTDLGTPAYYALFDENTFILGPTPECHLLHGVALLLLSRVYCDGWNVLAWR
jgi:hypothetical protein